ncbi:unannotated protein [freshwater metagenome]|uniref:Unannotated protein n=1 Tax=freshwater metagenome TaxID=449393 RepID=A0A6J7KU69_9ZZZZ
MTMHIGNVRDVQSIRKQVLVYTLTLFRIRRDPFVAKVVRTRQ